MLVDQVTSEMTKKCSKCFKDLPLVKFSKDSTKSSGYYSSCKDCCSKYELMRYRRDIVKRKALSVKSLRNKIKTDKVAHFKQVLRGHIRRVLRGDRGYTSKCRIYRITGLECRDLINYLHSTFEYNYGLPRECINLKDVQIDHIIPLITATTVQDIERLNHYTNLQLLFTEDNVHKGRKSDINTSV